MNGKDRPQDNAVAMPVSSSTPHARPQPGSQLSLENVHGSIDVPHHQAELLGAVACLCRACHSRQCRRYGILVTGAPTCRGSAIQVRPAMGGGAGKPDGDLHAGDFRRLGVVTGKDLAQCCRDWYPSWTRWPNWLMSEIAIGACDLAEVLGSAVALNLLFHIPLLWAVIITALDVLLLLALQRFGMRTIEAVVLLLVATIAICYFIEIFVLPQTQPRFLEIGHASDHAAFAAGGNAVCGGWHHWRDRNAAQSLPALGSGPEPSIAKDDASIRRALQFNTIDSTVALTVAFFVNAAILVLAATVFFGKKSVLASGGELITFSPESDWIRVAYLTLAPLLGTAAASTLFAVALLAAGQSSTIGNCGQVVMEGFMHWRIKPWVRRLITRIAFCPLFSSLACAANDSVTDLLTLSQVVLALQLPFAMFPLLHFTSSRARMGSWRNGRFLLIAGWTSAILITFMDIYGLPDSIRTAWHLIVGG